MKRIIFTLLSSLILIHFNWANTEQFTVQISPTRIDWHPHHAYTSTEAQIFTALYEGLTIFHPASLQAIPGAAEKWLVSENLKTITFTLRENLHWSNGEKITAEDFKHSWLQLLQPETEAEYASLLNDVMHVHEFRLGRAKAEEIGIKTPDERTLVVELERPSPQFLSILCHYSLAPVHKQFRTMKNWPELSIVPVNGPYIIQSYNEDEILMERNPHYWDKANVDVDTLQILFNDNPDTVMEQFNRSQIDWIASGMKTDSLAIPEALNIAPLFSTTYYYFSNANETWSNGNIRRALSMLLPWDEIRRDRLIPSTSLVPPIPDYPTVKDEFPPKDERRSEAMKLLEEAGYSQERTLPSLTIRIPRENDITAEIMAETWHEELGIDVQIEVVPFPHYYDSVKEGGYDIATLTWTGDYADPYTFLGMWTSTSSFNEAGFSNPQYDALLKESALLPHKERMNKMMEAEKILVYSAQVMTIEHYPAVNIIDRRFIEGWYPNALDIHPFKDIKIRLGYHIPGVVMR